MLDRPASVETASSGQVRRSHPRWPLAIAALAGPIGAAGVGVGAAGAHVGGGDLARTASTFLLIHAAVLVGGAALATALRRRAALLALALALALLALGAILFGGELSLAALLDWRPVPLAAPVGGLCLIAGWLCLSVAGIAQMLGPE